MADKDFRVKLGIEVGANAAIQGAITTVDSIQLDLAAGVESPALGQLAWDVEDNTVSLGLGVTSLKIGQEQLYFIKNQSGQTIGKGNVVMFAGTIGNSGRLLGRKAVADGSFPSNYIIGVASQNIVDGEDGYVASFGKIRQLDTSMFSEGDVLFANPAIPGTLSNTVPIAPNNKVVVAAVVNSDAANGELFVRVSFSDAVGDLEDVFLNNITNGQTIVWVSTNSRFEAATVGDAANVWVNANDWATLQSAYANDYTTLLSAQSNDGATLSLAHSNDYSTLLTAYANDYSTLLTASANDYNSFNTLTANIYNTFAYLNANVGGGGTVDDFARTVAFLGL
jgi:hypothetical protein